MNSNPSNQDLLDAFEAARSARRCGNAAQIKATQDEFYRLITCYKQITEEFSEMVRDGSIWDLPDTPPLP